MSRRTIIFCGGIAIIFGLVFLSTISSLEYSRTFTVTAWSIFFLITIFTFEYTYRTRSTITPSNARPPLEYGGRSALFGIIITALLQGILIYVLTSVSIQCDEYICVEGIILAVTFVFLPSLIFGFFYYRYSLSSRFRLMLYWQAIVIVGSLILGIGEGYLLYNIFPFATFVFFDWTALSLRRSPTSA